MSGHSKWSKVKHQKAVTDVVKSAAFTKAAHAIAIAVREGGGVTDPESNFHLRLAIEKARAVNMPKENITRAVERAAGAGSEAIEQITYEGYGPGGVALLIETATDNRQRTVAQVKNVLERAGGTIASPGSVAYQFERRGVLTVAKSTDSDSLFAAALDSGASDVADAGDFFEVYTPATALFQVKQLLEERGLVIDNAALLRHPTMPVTPPDDIRAKVDLLVDELTELADVHGVYTNMT